MLPSTDSTRRSGSQSRSLEVELAQPIRVVDGVVEHLADPQVPAIPRQLLRAAQPSLSDDRRLGSLPAPEGNDELAAICLEPNIVEVAEPVVKLARGESKLLGPRDDEMNHRRRIADRPVPSSR